MRDGETATLNTPDRPHRVLALWFRIRGSLSGVRSAANDIAKLRRKVPHCIKDFVVVTGEGLSDHEDEIIVIINVNEPTRDREAFADFSALVRKKLKGNFREVDYPTESLCDPRLIYDDKNFNGWHAVKGK